MEQLRLGIIAEGDKNSAEAVREIVRLILQDISERCPIARIIQVAGPIATGSKSKLLRKLEAHVQLCLRKREAQGILIVYDADDECPKDEAISLANKISTWSVGAPVAIAIAQREFEAWLIASIDSIAGKHLEGCNGIRRGVSFGGTPDTIADPKEWLSQHLQQRPGRPFRKYKETKHAREMSKHVDVTLATKRSRSFRRLVHAVEQVVMNMGHGYVSPM
ncbi:MAG: DUF4276 family protein [Candidatus Thorarchaeota archaeon]